MYYSLRDIRSESSMCWNSAELPTALDRHSCSVTSIMAKYSILPGGSITSTFADTMLPYRHAPITVVPMAIAHVTSTNKAYFPHSIYENHRITYMRVTTTYSTSRTSPPRRCVACLACPPQSSSASDGCQTGTQSCRTSAKCCASRGS